MSVSIEIFGYVAQAVTFTSYALEPRSRWWTVVFMLGCVLAGFYAAAHGAWAIVVAEVIWIAAAIYKFIHVTRRGQ